MPYYRRRFKTGARSRKTYRTSTKSYAYANRRKPRRKVYNRRYPKARMFRAVRSSPISTTKLIRFRYNDTGFQAALVSGSAYQATQVFRGNSVYDPDYSGVGVQPYYLDQWANFYSQYTVAASAIKIYFSTSASEANASAIRVFLIPSRSTSLTYHDAADLAQTKYAKTLVFNQGDDSRKCKAKHYCKTSLLYPTFKASNNNFTTEINTNPNFQWYWHIFFDSSGGEASDIDVWYDVKITYYTKLLLPIQVNES